MAIPPKQIESSNEANLLWEISKQLDIINTTTYIITTTTTTTLAV